MAAVTARDADAVWVKVTAGAADAVSAGITPGAGSMTATTLETKIKQNKSAYGCIGVRFG